MGTQQSSITSAQAGAIERAQHTQSALLDAQTHLYAALRRPQPTRERRWAGAVAPELGAALAALRDHRLEVEQPTGLYEELRREAPWTNPRLRQVTAQLRRIESEIVDLQIEVARAKAGDYQGLPHIRGDAERILSGIRDLLSKEADLIYERFREPAALD